VSAANEKAGVKYTTIYKGDRKNDLSPHAPLSDEAKAMLEEEVNDHYGLFVETVARNRGMKVAEVIATQAGIYMGDKAVERRLADAVIAPNQVVAMILNDINEEAVGMGVRETGEKTEEKEEKEVKIMNVVELREKYPDLVAEIESGVETKMSAVFEKDKEAMNEKLLRLEKAEMIRREKEIALEAESVWTRALSSSDVPERLHEKVMVQVSHNKFVKDGLLDRGAFAEAVQAEVADWESRVPKTSVMGVGVQTRDVETDGAKKAKLDAKADDELVDALFQMSGGR